MGRFQFVRRSGRRWENCIVDVGCERDKDGVVVLEERSGCVFEEHVADAFANGGVMVCYTYVGF